jgi:hypothetical protein
MTSTASPAAGSGRRRGGQGPAQRPLAFAAGFIGRVKPRSFGLDLCLRRPGSFRRRLVQASQFAFRQPRPLKPDSCAFTI